MKNLYKFVLLSVLMGGSISAEGLFSCNKESPCCDYAFNPPIVDGDPCCGWSGHLEYLYMRARNRLIAAEKVDGFFENLSSFEPARRIYHDLEVKYDWDSGWRVGLDYKLPCDCWTVALTWTHYLTDFKMHQNTNAEEFLSDGNVINGQIIIPHFNQVIWIDSAIDNTFANIFRAQSKLNYNQLNLTWQREYYVGSCLTLTPVLGLELLFINQRYDDHFEKIVQSESRPSTIIDDRFQNKFTGLGVQGGVKTNFILGCGLGIYGGVTGSILYGNFDISQKFFSCDLLAPFQNNYSGNYNQVIPKFDGEIGLRWAKPMFCNKSLFTAFVGWEGHVIFNQNQYRVIRSHPSLFNNGEEINLEDPSESNLTLQGIVFRIGLSL